MHQTNFEYFISLANYPLVFSVETNKNLDKIKIHALFGKRHLSRLCLNDVLKPNRHQDVLSLLLFILFPS